jgi:ribonucleoside-triphosphate reductase
VENVLMLQQFEDVAKAYITYRQKRAESRDVKNIVVEVDKTMDEYL